MTKISPPPIQHPITTAQLGGNADMPWVLYFNQMYQGDTGTEWTPNFANLTEVGGDATIEGRYHKIGQWMAVFYVKVTPATNTSATAGTTYIDNFPEEFKDTGVIFAMANGTGTNSGECLESNQRIFTPAWTTVTTPVYLMGACFL